MHANSKLSILLYTMAIAFALLAASLTRLQIFQVAKYREMALNNRIRRVALSAPRGTIRDRHGNILAGNRPSYDVEIVLDEIPDLEAAIAQLSAILKIDPQVMLKKVRSGRYLPYLPVIMARDVPIESVTKLLEARRGLAGINIAVRALREYPNGKTAAHVLGVLGQISPGEYDRWKNYGYGPQDIIGKTGIELAFNAELVGKAGGMQVQVDSRGNKDKVLGYKVPVKGKDIWLTLDLSLQKTAEGQVSGKRGAAVVLDIPTAEVLAMASAPAFDPAVFVESSRGKERMGLLTDSKHPLMNRAITGLYPAGSVFKTIVGLAGLQAGTITSQTRFYCPGFFSLGDRQFSCWRKHGHGTVGLEEALKYSCNVFFYNAGLQTRQDRIEEAARGFFLGERTGIILPHEAAGLLPTPVWKKHRGLGAWTKGDTVNLSIGQGFLLVTPLQMATLGACLGNSGIWRTPQLVCRDHHTEPVLRKVFFDKQHWKAIGQGMIRVVNDKDATGYSGHLDRIVIAGKTGTVQTSSDPKNKRDHAWFVGFAPAQNPSVAVAVILEHAGTGGLTAAPVAREIFKTYFNKQEVGA